LGENPEAAFVFVWAKHGDERIDSKPMEGSFGDWHEEC
jgi:hypothetical protein